MTGIDGVGLTRKEGFCTNWTGFNFLQPALWTLKHTLQINMKTASVSEVGNPFLSQHRFRQPDAGRVTGELARFQRLEDVFELKDFGLPKNSFCDREGEAPVIFGTAELGDENGIAKMISKVVSKNGNIPDTSFATLRKLPVGTLTSFRGFASMKDTLGNEHYQIVCWMNGWRQDFKKIDTPDAKTLTEADASQLQRLATVGVLFAQAGYYAGINSIPGCSIRDLHLQAFNAKALAIKLKPQLANPIYQLSIDTFAQTAFYLNQIPGVHPFFVFLPNNTFVTIIMSPSFFEKYRNIAIAQYIGVTDVGMMFLVDKSEIYSQLLRTNNSSDSLIPSRSEQIAIVESGSQFLTSGRVISMVKGASRSATPALV
jgi:hypothetical protein